MSRFRRPVILGVVASLALTVFATATTASAEPVSNSYALVGSDTLQDSLNAITNGTSISNSFIRVTSNGSSLGNFDAFGSTLMQTKSNGTYFVRPQGSTNGRNALIASIKGTQWQGKTITGAIDIARSSSDWGSNRDDNAGQLLYVPYGRDAVSYAYRGSDSDLSTLTTAQLKTLYEADDQAQATIGGVAFKPLIPQTGSGTRDFFLKAIGVAAADLGTFVTSGLPENDGSVLTVDNQIIPFSAASWIAQVNLASGVNTVPTNGVVKMGKPNAIAPYTGTAPNLVPNQTYYSSAYGRDTFLIVEYARTVAGAKFDPALVNLLNPTRGTSLTNMGTAPNTVGAVKRKFGFLPVADVTPVRAYPNI